MKWVNTEQNGWDVPIATEWIREHFKLSPGPKENRTGAHWADITSGDELLLLSDGGWLRSANGQTVPGQYRLFRFFAQTPRVQPIAYLLEPIGGGHFHNTSSDVSQRSDHVRAKCVNYIEALFAVEPLPWSGRAASSRKLRGT